MAYQKIIHLSDLHITTASGLEISRFRYMSYIISKYYAGCPVIITGDITDSATKRQMQLARECIDKLAETNLVLIVPGNHDYAALGNFYRKKAPWHWNRILGTPFGPGVRPRRWMSAEEDPVGVEGIGVYENDLCAFIGIDSGDPFDKEALARGIITQHLADALAATLKKYSNKVRVVFLHHHPFADDLFLELIGADRLLKALKYNCELLLFGHNHNIGAWWGRNDIPLILASHKTTQPVTNTRMLISVIEILKRERAQPEFSHSLKVV